MQSHRHMAPWVHELESAFYLTYETYLLFISTHLEK